MWLHIFENGDYPIHDRNSVAFKPDADLWHEDKDFRYWCYVLSGQYIYFGFYSSPNCFNAYKYQDIEKTYRAYKNRLSTLYTESDLKEMEAYSWLYLDQRKPEKFCEDGEIINEDTVTYIKYYDNNSIEEMAISDRATGELLYYMRWTRSQYYSEIHERELYTLTAYERIMNGKHMKVSRKFNRTSKQYKWIIDFPITLRGYTLDQILAYANHTKKNH
jgi:hypothetical protein